MKRLNANYKSVVAASKPVSDDMRCLVPEYDSLRTVLQRQRSSALPKLPKCKEDIVLEGEWCMTSDGEHFVLPSDNNDMIIFTTQANLAFLSQCKTLYVDGTFKTCPTLYAQLYSIQGLYAGYVIPLVYVLLPDKTSTTYYVMIGRIRDAVAKQKLILNPEVIISDFESGLLEAVRLQFPNAQHLGCHFHYGQALWRKFQELGLVVAFRDNEKIRCFF